MAQTAMSIANSGVTRLVALTYDVILVIVSLQIES